MTALRIPANVPTSHRLAPPDAAAPSRLEVRLARDWTEIEAAQRLRYRVFMQELGAVGECDASGLDVDRFDSAADHLIVLDHACGGTVVGTYRLMRRNQAVRCGGFYTEHEFDIGAIVAMPGEVLELGRSCIDPAYRNRSTIQLLWRGIAAHVFAHRVVLMFGCASLPGADAASHGHALDYLHRYHLAPASVRPVAIAAERVAVALADEPPSSARQAVAALPPLLKGYLRLGGWIGQGAVLDRRFNTTDVCMVVMTDHVTDRYFRHYVAPEARELPRAALAS
jgi:L-ornithine Nalpha-acyltransferase